MGINEIELSRVLKLQKNLETFLINCNHMSKKKNNKNVMGNAN